MFGIAFLHLLPDAQEELGGLVPLFPSPTPCWSLACSSQR